MPEVGSGRFFFFSLPVQSLFQRFVWQTPLQCRGEKLKASVLSGVRGQARHRDVSSVSRVFFFFVLFPSLHFSSIIDTVPENVLLAARSARFLRQHVHVRRPPVFNVSPGLSAVSQGFL